MCLEEQYLVLQPPKTSALDSVRLAQNRAYISPPKVSPEIEKLKTQVLNGEDLKKVDITLFPQLVLALKQQRDFLLSLNLYQDSEQYDKALHRVIRMGEDYIKLSVQRSVQQGLKARLANAKREMDDIQKMAKKQLDNMELKLEKQRNDLTQRHQKEIEDFNADWDTEKKQRLYNRTSNTLRGLRKQAILLLNQHRYEEMKVVEQEADKLEREECIQSSQLMELDYSAQLELLLKRQKSEVEKLLTKQNALRNQHKAAKEFDMQVARQRLRNLEHGLEEAANTNKFWNLKAKSILYSSKALPVHATPRGHGKKEINVSEFNTLALPQLGTMSLMKQQKREKLREKLRRRISTPVKPVYRKAGISCTPSLPCESFPTDLAPRVRISTCRKNESRRNSNFN